MTDIVGQSHVETVDRRRVGGSKRAARTPGSTHAPEGPVLGPGPVAETLPDPLTTLEQELWVPPLRTGIAEALALTGTIPSRVLRRSPIVTVVRGRVVADLSVLGVAPSRSRIIAKVDPRPPARRLVAAWRVGRLKAAFSALAADLVERTDHELESVGPPANMEDDLLFQILDRAPRLLRALHGHEVLAGLLLPAGEATAASAALRALAAARADGLTDGAAIATRPVTLALVPPAIGRPVTLPPVQAMPAVEPTAAPGTGAAELREALRLRARWVQELTARVAAELGQRAAVRGALPMPEVVRHLTLDELRAAIRGELTLLDLGDRDIEDTEPLPAAFRLTASGEVVAEGRNRHQGLHGTGVAPGRGIGPAHLDEDWPPDGAVLVVRTLDPRLASYLPVLSAVVSETGTELSHVAIVARELGVPAVVGVADATERFQPGATLVVDGSTGEVQVLDDGDGT